MNEIRELDEVFQTRPQWENHGREGSNYFSKIFTTSERSDKSSVM